MSGMTFDEAPLVFREITVSVRGVTTPVICPVWCDLDHDGQHYTSLSDVSHFSPMVAFGPAAGGTEDESAVDADLHWMPNAEAARGPQLLIWSGGDPIELDVDAAEKLIGKLTGLVDQMRAMRAAT